MKKTGQVPDSRGAPVVHSSLFSGKFGGFGDWNNAQNVSVTIETSGRPVLVAIVPEEFALGGPEEGAYTIELTDSTRSVSDIWRVSLLRDSTVDIATVETGMSAYDHAISVEIPFSICGFDLPEPGSHTYTIRVEHPSRTQSELAFVGARLVAYEL
jgi:hypothetical protein